METYLIVMVTVLVATQVIRITQNAMSLYRHGKKIKMQDKQIEMRWDTVNRAAKKYLGEDKVTFTNTTINGDYTVMLSRSKGGK